MSDDPLSPQYIERLAVDAGLNITALCRAAGVAKSAWYRWRKGERSISVDGVRKLRDAALRAKEAAE